MKNIPTKIYLNLGFDKDEIDINTIDDFESLKEVSWSDTRINDQDIEYHLSKENNTDDIDKSTMIEFAEFLTGHDKETLEQLYRDFKR